MEYPPARITGQSTQQRALAFIGGVPLSSAPASASFFLAAERWQVQVQGTWRNGDSTTEADCDMSLALATSPRMKSYSDFIDRLLLRDDLLEKLTPAGAPPRANICLAQGGDSFSYS
jgi:hypothetical protein